MEQKNEIAYLCGKCKKEVSKDAVKCPHCNANLGDIKCPYCFFKGTVDDFKNDICPKCGKRRSIDIKKTMNKKNKNPKIVHHESSNQDKTSVVEKQVNKNIIYFTVGVGVLVIFLLGIISFFYDM